VSAKTFRVEITNGQVKSLEAEPLPAAGRGTLTILATPLKSVEVVDGPDGFPVLRGGGIITSEMVKELENEPW
jgi:hypothetical protein